MSSNLYVSLFEYSIKLTLVAALLGSLISGCGDRPNESAKTETTISCSNPDKPIILFASKYDPTTKQGWKVNGNSFSEQKKDVPMGRFDNQIVVDIPIQLGAAAARIKVPVSATIPNAAIILDTIWYSGAKEIGRSSPSIELGKALGNVIDTIQTVLPSADHLALSARPWREIDGILTVGVGEIAWCNK